MLGAALANHSISLHVIVAVRVAVASFVIAASFVWPFVIAASGAAVALPGLLPRYPNSFAAVDR